MSDLEIQIQRLSILNLQYHDELTKIVELQNEIEFCVGRILTLASRVEVKE